MIVTEASFKNTVTRSIFMFSVNLKKNSLQVVVYLCQSDQTMKNTLRYIYVHKKIAGATTNSSRFSARARSFIHQKGKSAERQSFLL